MFPPGSCLFLEHYLFSFIFDLLIDSELCRCFQLIYYLLFMQAVIFICDSIDLSGTLDLQ